MPFKIVQTKERGKVLLSIVPSKWEQKGILFWPKQRNDAHKISDGDSVPEKTWEQIPCICKREFLSRGAAEAEMEEMEEMSDTEGTDTEYLSISSSKKIGKKPMLIPNLNDLVPASMQKKMHSENIEILNIETNLNEANMTSVALSPKPLLEPGNKNQVLELVNHHFPNDYGMTYNIISDGTTNESVLHEQNKILENQEKIMAAIAKLQTTLDTLPHILDTQGFKKLQQNDIVCSSPQNKMMEAINSLEELEKFEEKLKDHTYMTNIVNSMSFICGTKGKENGFDSCYRLIDFFLTRQFVTKCSWSGNTRTNATRKIALQFFERFRACFFKIIAKADSTFSETECDIFFKRILKNSTKRNVSKKIESRHKSRPKNLVYKKQNKIVEGIQRCEEGIQQNNEDTEGRVEARVITENNEYEYTDTDL